MKKIISVFVTVFAIVTFSTPSSAQTSGEYVDIICNNGESYSGVVISSNNLVLKIKVADGNERIIYVEDIVKVIRGGAKDETEQPSSEVPKGSVTPQVFTERYVNEHIGQKANIIMSTGKSQYGVYILGAKDKFIVVRDKPSYGGRRTTLLYNLKNIKAIELLNTEPGFKLNIDLSSFDEIKGHVYDIAVEGETVYKDVVILDYDLDYGSICCNMSNGRKKYIPFFEIKELKRKY